MAHESLGQRLRFYRRKAGLTQGQMAEKLGTSTSLVSQWERGIIEPTYERILQLAHIFETIPSELTYTPNSLQGLQIPHGYLAGTPEPFEQILSKLESIERRLLDIEIKLGVEAVPSRPYQVKVDIPKLRGILTDAGIPDMELTHVLERIVDLLIDSLTY